MSRALTFGETRDMILSYNGLSYLSIIEGLCGESEEVVAEFDLTPGPGLIGPIPKVERLRKELADVIVYLYLYFDFHGVRPEHLGLREDTLLIEIVSEERHSVVTATSTVDRVVIPLHYLLMRYCCRLAEIEKKLGRKKNVTRLQRLSVVKSICFAIHSCCFDIAKQYNIDLEGQIRLMPGENDERRKRGDFGEVQDPDK